MKGTTGEIMFLLTEQKKRLEIVVHPVVYHHTGLIIRSFFIRTC